jgi:hypothetical protein
VFFLLTPCRYYHRLSQKNCESLVREKLGFNVLPGWVVVLENRSCNSVVNKVPNFNTLKQEMRFWLGKKEYHLV